MSAAASAEMIETPPVLNFEEIDYKEIEVEEVSEGPAGPLVPRARPPWAPPGRPRAPRALLPGAVPPLREEGPPRLPGTPAVNLTGPAGLPVDATAAGTSEPRRSSWERRCQLTAAGPAAGCLAVEFYLNGVDLFRTLKFHRPFCHPR